MDLQLPSPRNPIRNKNTVFVNTRFSKYNSAIRVQSKPSTPEDYRSPSTPETNTDDHIRIETLDPVVLLHSKNPQAKNLNLVKSTDNMKTPSTPKNQTQIDLMKIRNTIGKFRKEYT